MKIQESLLLALLWGPSGFPGVQGFVLWRGVIWRNCGIPKTFGTLWPTGGREGQSLGIKAQRGRYRNPQMQTGPAYCSFQLERLILTNWQATVGGQKGVYHPESFVAGSASKQLEKMPLELDPGKENGGSLGVGREGVSGLDLSQHS